MTKTEEEGWNLTLKAHFTYNSFYFDFHMNFCESQLWHIELICLVK